MENPETFFDSYILYRNMKEKNIQQYVNFDCLNDGKIMFYYHPNPRHICIYMVIVKHPRQGIFTRFIKELIKKELVDEIYILSVSTPDMLCCLDKLIKESGINFINHGGDFTWKRTLFSGKRSKK